MLIAFGSPYHSRPNGSTSEIIAAIAALMAECLWNDEYLIGPRIFCFAAGWVAVNIKSSLENVRQNIGAAKAVDETMKAQLDHLIQQLSENLAKAPAEKAGDAEAVALAASELVTKATKERPNKKSVEISAKGLLEAAEGVASVVPIALQIVSTVSKFITGV